MVLDERANLKNGIFFMGQSQKRWLDISLGSTIQGPTSLESVFCMGHYDIKGQSLLWPFCQLVGSWIQGQSLLWPFCQNWSGLKFRANLYFGLFVILFPRIFCSQWDWAKMVDLFLCKEKSMHCFFMFFRYVELSNIEWQQKVQNFVFVHRITPLVNMCGCLLRSLTTLKLQKKHGSLQA